MNQIIIGKAAGKNVSISIDDLMATRLLIQANSGGGKSWLLRRLAEQFFGKVPVLIIDPEGEFATLREKFDYVLIGEGGDAPAHVRSARLLAEKLLSLRAYAICDLFETFRKTPIERHLWVKEFLSGLLDAPKSLWRPTIIIVDEAHTYCPEQGESPAEGVMIGLSTAGRKRGFCPIWATQRLALVDKSATSQLQNRMVGLTFEDVDVVRAVNLLSVAKEDQHDFKQKVKVLEPGDFFAFGRAISRRRILLRVGPIQTSHPEVGKGKKTTAPPPPPEKVKALLPKLADLPKLAEEKAKTEKELNAEIRSLRAQLRVQPKVISETVAKVTDPRAVERAVREVRSHFEKEVSKFQSIIKQQWKVFAAIARQAAEAANVKLPEFLPPKLPASTPVAKFSPAPKFAEDRQPTWTPKETDGGQNGKLRAGAERMLAALATWHPNGMTQGQMRAHAGLKKSGTFTTYLGDLRRGDYIEERDGMIYATEKGLEYCQHVPSAPTTTEEVVNIWKPKLRDGARRMLDVLVSLGGESISREELGERAGLSKSGTFTTYLGDLRTARLAVINHDKCIGQ